MKPTLAIVSQADVSDAELVKSIKTAQREADTSSWAVADGYAELYRREWTQQKIAEKCEVTQSYVSKCIACAKKYYPGNNRPRFCEAYGEIKSGASRASQDDDDERPKPSKPDDNIDDGPPRRTGLPRTNHDDEDYEGQPGDTPDVVWRRGLMYRSERALELAVYSKDWLQFEADSEVVSTARAAADAWNEVAVFLEEMIGGKTKTKVS